MKVLPQKSFKPELTRRTLAEIAVIAVIYYLTARLGRTAAPPPGIATVVWPPSGISLAALLILGTRVWPGIFLGAFLANNWAAWPHTGPSAAISFLLSGICIDTGSLLQALLGAALYRRWLGDRNPFDRLKQSLTFILIALAMCLVGCTIGVASLYFGGAMPWNDLFSRWWTWWVGDTGGILVMTPMLLSAWFLRWPDWNRARWGEAVLVFAASAIFAIVIFVWWRPPVELRYPADLLLLPLIAWVGYRFTQREVALLVLLILTIALTGTLHGRGPYHGTTPWSPLPVLQAFIGILSILSITVGAVITERKAAGDALEASEHWLRETQRISRIGSYVLDIRSGHWTRSEILNDIFGIGTEYPHTRDAWYAIIHPDDRAAVVAHLETEVIGQGRRFEREFRIVRPHGGGTRWVLCGGEMRFETRKSPGRLAGTCLDITDRKDIEAQLLQSHKMESIGRLAGGVAHDFNNLLTVINGYTDVVLNRIPNDGWLYQQVREIRSAGDRAAELTTQLLAFSRKQVLQPKVLSLNDIVRDSDKMLRRIIGEEIELICVLHPALQPVEADPGQLHQVIVNLAVNARDAMPGGGKLMIETANSGSAVTLTVGDTGHGMDRNTLDHVFEPFFTTKGVGKGTGLGLATVYGIVRQSAGQISVQSEVGCGTTFVVTLPATSKAGGADLTILPPSPGSGTVLLVEDEEGVRRLIATILEQHGYRVLTAPGGAEAIRICEQQSQPIDLLITDVVMPRMRGPELAAHLRNQQPRMSILFISGYTDPSITSQVMSDGAHFLRKPFAVDALLRAVNDALGRQSHDGSRAGAS